MYEELIGKKIKCVWRDGESSKAIYGIVEKTDDLFLTLKADKDQQSHYIAFTSIINIVGVD